MVVDTSGNVGIGTASPQITHAYDGQGLEISGGTGADTSGITRYSGRNGQSEYTYSEIGHHGDSRQFQFRHHVAGVPGTLVAKIHSDGDFYTNDGTISSLSSDVRVKKNIVDIDEGLDIVNQLRPVSFQYNGKCETHPDDERVYKGFIADELKEVAPFYMAEGKGKIDGVEVDDFKTLNMGRMTPMIIKAIQELSAKVEALENE
jgi:hypothetical protein